MTPKQEQTTPDKASCTFIGQWVSIAEESPEIDKEFLVCREDVDANTRAMLTKDGWIINPQWWCQIEANAIKADCRGEFKPTHWWKSANKD